MLLLWSSATKLDLDRPIIQDDVLNVISNAGRLTKMEWFCGGGGTNSNKVLQWPSWRTARVKCFGKPGCSRYRMVVALAMAMKTWCTSRYNYGESVDIVSYTYSYNKRAHLASFSCRQEYTRPFLRNDEGIRLFLVFYICFCPCPVPNFRASWTKWNHL